MFTHRKQQTTQVLPTRVLVIGFALLIFVGALLLTLPMASADGKSVGFVNALFTATSAGCVTGLVVVETMTAWTLFGKIIILFLIQVGGLGFMTMITIFLIVLKRKITLKERIVIQESLNQLSPQGMVRLVIKVVIGTLLVETVAAVILTFAFLPQYGLARSMWYGVFHSISAFCNAGFDIISHDSLVPYVDNVAVNVVVTTLIVLGGLGFTVWMDVVAVIRHRKHKWFVTRAELRHISLHSKIVISCTLFLIAVGTLFFLVSEYDNQATLGELSLHGKLWAAYFQAVTLRTAGFYSIHQAAMNYSSKFMSVILMIIGGSPGGTAGGIKTVTVSVIMLSVLSVIRGEDSINAFRKHISFQTLQKSLTVMSLIMLVLFVSTGILSFTEVYSGYHYEFMDLLFETSSALGTVGLTLGITPYLTTAGKLVICACMFIGRLGPITVVVGLSARQKAARNRIHYPEEKVIVG